MSLETWLEIWTRGWRGPLLAAMVAIVAGLPGLIALPTLDRDEARFAEATAQMLETRDFVSIRFQDAPRNKKPVGIHWLQAAAVSAVSHVEDRAIWAYRIPSLLGAALAAAACAWGARAFLTRAQGAVAGALLGASFMLSTEAFFAKTDAVLCGAITLSLAALGRLYIDAQGGLRAGRRVKMLFWAGLALAILVKGPVGPMVVALTLAALAIWDRKVAWMRDLSWGWGLIFVAAVVGPWAMAITVATDGSFWGAALGGDLAPKLAGGQESHGAWPGTYTLLFPLLTFPAVLLAPAAAMAAWRDRIEPGVRFALCWLIPTWIAFELFPTKLPHYVLPTFGAVAWLIVHALSQPPGRIARWLGAGLAMLAALILAAVGPAAAFLIPAPEAMPWAVVSAITFVIAGAVASVLLLRKASGRALGAGVLAAVIAHAVLFAVVAPALTPLWLSSRAADALSQAHLMPREGITPGPVTVAGYDEPSLVFALGAETELGDGQAAADAIADGRPVIVEDRQATAFAAALRVNGDRAQGVATVSGLDYSNGHHDILRLYKPASTPPETKP